MKILSVANVASPVGGTGRCALDCVAALPAHEHAMLFVTGNAAGARAMREEAGWLQLWVGRGRIAQVCADWRPDLVLCHNTGADQLPREWPRPKPRVVYYTHSTHPIRPADVQLMVSAALARQCRWGRDCVLHQPVAPPPGGPAERHERFTVGRLCTPHKSKWTADVLPFYGKLAAALPEARFEFVGCPEGIRSQMEIACRGRALFHGARPESRSLLWRWHAYAYDGPWESYGRVVCEAQQAGCVPVVMRKGGFVEQVRHGVDGWLCSGVDQFASALVECRRRWAEVSAEARRAGSRRGSLSRWAAEFERRCGIADTPASEAA